MTKATQTNVDPDKLATGKDALRAAVERYKAATDKMTDALGDFHSHAGDENIDGGLQSRAEKGRDATSKLGDSTRQSTAKDADAVDAAHKKYTPQDEDQHQNISKTGQSLGNTDAAVSESHKPTSGTDYQRPAQAQTAGPGSGSGGSASSGGGGASGSGFQIPNVSLPQGGGGVPMPQVPDIPLPQNQDRDEHDGDSQQ